MPRVREDITNGLARVVSLAGLFSLAGTAVGQLGGSSWWGCELACHFTLYYALALAPATVLHLAPTRFRRAKLGYACAGGLLLNLALLAPLYWPTTEPAPGKSLRVMSLNVLTSNSRYDDVLRLVDNEDPDVLVLMEINQAWATAMAPLAGRYGAVKVDPRSDNFGMALYTRLPVAGMEIIEIAESRTPTIAAELLLSGQGVSVLATHPLPPTSAAYAGSRDRQLAEAAKWAAARSEPTILLGDLNVTRFSPRFRSLLRRSGLNDSAVGHGYRATWYVGRLIGLPIDQVLYSDALAVVDRRIGPGVGSDHRAVIVDFTLRE
ncbi:MAG: endonuclease/exonuclease/phosphatase family protein [Planctomycetales bacterium]|nr:endonuclease/exonuclease/phosphatase family protein [Planctomycetales bacterium]